MDILVQNVMSDETHHLRVDPTDRIADIKTRIEHKFKIPVDRQRLVHSGRYLYDDWQLLLKEIRQHALLELYDTEERSGNEITIRFDKFDKKKETLLVKCDLNKDTVAVLKSRICAITEISVHHLHLFYLTVDELDNHRTLKSYNINEASLLKLRVRRPITGGRNIEGMISRTPCRTVVYVFLGQLGMGVVYMILYSTLRSFGA